jgi:preprotein translocase subunit SecG
MQTMVLVLHLLICVVLVGAVLMQRSEGGALGMGGGGTGGLISGRGAADMMVRITSWVGGLFFVTSLGLAVLAGTRPAERSVIDDGQSRGGIQFNIPGLPGAGAPTTAPPAPAAPLSAPAPTPAAGGDSALAPAPGGAVTRAGPLAPETDAPKAAPPPRAPVGAAPAAPKATPAPATAPMIPLPAASPTPASGTESGQPAAPSPPPTRDPTGPDE